MAFGKSGKATAGGVLLGGVDQNLARTRGLGFTLGRCKAAAESCCGDPSFLAWSLLVLPVAAVGACPSVGRSDNG